MAGQIVHHHDVARPENGGEELFGPGPEDVAVHRAVKRHGCAKTVAAQGGNEGCGAPVAVRGLGQKSLADGTAAKAAHHVGGEAGFIDEDEARDIKRRLLLAPGFACRLDVGPVLLGGVQGFF